MNSPYPALDVRNDRFGNPIDPSVGYARGLILGSPADDARRMARAWKRTQELIEARGSARFAVLTGNAGDFPLADGDAQLCNEWIAPGVASSRLRELALFHLGGGPQHAFSLLSRTSAAIVAWLMIHASHRTVLSVVPSGGHGHSSIHFAAVYAGSRIVEVEADRLDEALLAELVPACAIITSVTSSMEELSAEEIRSAASALRAAGCPSLLDDAYGARIRPIFRGQAKSLQTGVDVAVTNGDKVGLGGPRCALLAGRADLVEQMAVWAAEAGTDGRGPIMVSMLRALERFTPEQLLQDARDGAQLTEELVARVGSRWVKPGLLGPMITEEDALGIALERSGTKAEMIRPAEVTAAVAMRVLEQGIITVNSHGQPGARVSLRLKPTTGCLDAAGGAAAIAEAFDRAFDWAAGNLHRPSSYRSLILG